MNIGKTLQPLHQRIISLFAIVVVTAMINLMPLATEAEYRAFRLQITKINRDPQNTEPPEIRTTMSTLDPLQYPYYYPLADNEIVSYTETWMCRGRTSDFAPICPPPPKKSKAKIGPDLSP